jgi:excisionase family DNA binding protein
MTDPDLDAENDPLLTVPEISTMLRISEWTVREWIKADILHGWRAGLRNYRVRRSELDRFLREREKPSPTPQPPVDFENEDPSSQLRVADVDDA